MYEHIGRQFFKLDMYHLKAVFILNICLSV